MNEAILPGATLGVLGSGQLGRMFAVAARQMGYGVQVYSPEAETPAGQVADREWTAAYEDLDRLTAFARHVDVVTLEFENVPLAALHHLEGLVPVRPGPRVLEAAQNRLKEKRSLRSCGLPTADFAAIHDLQELEHSLTAFSGRGVLKTASWGYDGKGQKTLGPGSDLAKIWANFSGSEAILEAFVDFRRELSVIAVRNSQGETCTYDPILNTHHNHILDVSVVPAEELSAELKTRAREIAVEVVRELEVVGVLCVEMFLTRDNRLLVNEIAPRPHNSGHLTIEAHATSQFQQQVRAICGLPLGSTQLRQPAAMANLLGDVWSGQDQPRWQAVLSYPELHLHLYGKTDPRPGRKMGHMTALAASAAEAEQLVRAARSELNPAR